MIQESRVLAAFPENPGLTPSMHMADYNRLPLQLIERPLLDSMGPEVYLSGRCLLNVYGSGFDPQNWKATTTTVTTTHTQC